MKTDHREPPVQRAPKRKETDIRVRLGGQWVTSEKTGKREPSPALLAFAEALGEFCADLYLEGRLPGESEQLIGGPVQRPNPASVDDQPVGEKARQSAPEAMTPEDVLTPLQVGELLQIPMKTISALCRRGDIPGARKVGRQWRIPRWGVDAMFANDGLPKDAEAPGRSDPGHSRSGSKLPMGLSEEERHRHVLGLLRAPLKTS